MSCRCLHVKRRRRLISTADKRSLQRVLSLSKPPACFRRRPIPTSPRICRLGSFAQLRIVHNATLHRNQNKREKRKTFDCVLDVKLIQMLNKLSIPGRTQNFLAKRAFRAKVGEEYSKYIEVTSHSCNAVVFVDHVKIKQTIESPSDAQNLPNGFDRLSELSHEIKNR